MGRSTRASRRRPRSCAGGLHDSSLDEVCSQGHPMVIRLGRVRRFLACSMYPEHKETRELPGADGRTPGAAEVGPDGAPAEPAASRSAPKCGETEGGSWSGAVADSGRSWAARVIRTATTSRRRTASAGSARIRGGLPHMPHGKAGDATRPAHGIALLGLLALPEMRLHDLT